LYSPLFQEHNWVIKQGIGVLIHLLYTNPLITISIICIWYTTQAYHEQEFHSTDYWPLSIKQIGIWHTAINEHVTALLPWQKWLLPHSTTCY